MKYIICNLNTILLNQMHDELETFTNISHFQKSSKSLYYQYKRKYLPIYLLIIYYIRMTNVSFD